MAFSGSQITRLSFKGDMTRLFGSFSGKTVTELRGHRPIAPWLKKNRQMKKGTRI